jgi:polyisoprenoid-binding protein YceI
MTTTAIATTTTYGIDKTHSDATFSVRHLLSKVRGRFSDFEGTIAFDEQHPEQSSVEISIHAASIDTSVADRDAHLRSADFFDVERFSTLTFRSGAIAATGKDEFRVAGDLTIHGVTRPVSLAVEYLGKARDPWGNERIAFEAQTTINRKDYGLNWNAALETGGVLVGDEVTITLSLQAVPKQA